MVSKIHSVVPRFAIFFALPVTALAIGAYFWSIRPYEVPGDTDIFAVVEGRWAWTTNDSGCAANPHTISFTEDHAGMIITAARPYYRADSTLDSVAYYDIERHTRSAIRGAIRGETRRTPDGRLVVWDLVLKSPRRYAWHRTDWPPAAYTAEIERCVDVRE